MSDEHTSPPTSQEDTFAEMLARGILDSKYQEVADGLFRQENFTLLVLHAHLLIEKALNHHLAAAGVPEVLLGPEGMEFHHKYRAYMQMQGSKHTGQNLYSVLNTLRNNIAHDFWDESQCVKNAFERFLVSKKNRKVLAETSASPLDAVKLLFLMLATNLGIVVPRDGQSPPAGIRRHE